SLQQAQKIDLGFRPENRLMFSVDLELQGYDEARGRRFQKQLIERLRQLPGGHSASFSSHVQLGYNNYSGEGFNSSGVPTGGGTNEDSTSFYNNVAADYFKTLGIPLLQGREFNERDDENAPRVAVVNETMARKLWPNDSPLGKQFRLRRDGPL